MPMLSLLQSPSCITDVSLVLQVASFVVSSFTAPTGVIAAVYVFAILQIVGCYQIYCRPTFGFAYNYMIRCSCAVHLCD